MKKRTLAFILSLVMIISVMVPGTLATDVIDIQALYDSIPDCDCGMPNDNHTLSCAWVKAFYGDVADPFATPAPECNCGAADDNHAETCPLYKEVEEEDKCSCGSETDEHAEDCPLYKESEEPTCNCGSTDDTHAEDCPLYKEPTEPTYFDKIMAAESVAAIYEALKADKVAAEALTSEEIDAIFERVDELDPEGDDAETEALTDLLIALPNFISGAEENKEDILMYGDEPVTLDLSKGAITITSSGYEGYNSSGTQVKGTSKNITVTTSTTTNNSIIFSGDNINCNLTLNNVKRSSGTGILYDNTCKNGNVTILLMGDNNIGQLHYTGDSKLKITSASGDGNTSGKLTVEAAEPWSAAIGGTDGDESFSGLTIAGGTIVATANKGAAIGGGGNGSAVVKITGGNVTATNNGPSAAIGGGGGETGAGGNAEITIEGGTVNATCNGEGVAIGGGGSINNATVGTATVKLLGGTITANSSQYAISGGYSQTKNTYGNTTVEISDSVVYSARINPNAKITGNMQVVFDLAKASVIFDGNSFTGKDSAGNVISGTHRENNRYIVRQSNNTTATANSIQLNGQITGTVNIEIDGINSSALNSIYIPASSGIEKNVVLSLKNENRINNLLYYTIANETSTKGQESNSTLKITSASGDGSTAGKLTVIPTKGSTDETGSVHYNAAIGGTDSQSGVTGLWIAGGTLHVETDTSNDCSAIGGGGNGYAQIDISGGYIYAKNASTGATIGGGVGYTAPGSGCDIVISGGTVIAENTGKYKQAFIGTSAQCYGVAIGGGSSFKQSSAGDVANVTITGGSVTAIVPKGQTAIGAGNSNQSDAGEAVVTIAGGTINCSGGIGGGSTIVGNGGNGTLNVTGGNLTVRGFIGGGATKSGEKGGTATVNISGANTVVKAASIGGGVAEDKKVVSKANVVIENGKIQAQVVMEGEGSTFDMSGGTIDNSKAAAEGFEFKMQNGGAVYVAKGEAKMWGGTIENCETTGLGGAIYVSGGNFTLSETGLIKNCTAEKQGGAVYVASGNATVSGGSIQGCSAQDGGAAYVTSGNFTMSGGTMKANKAEANGGAAYVTGGNFTMSGGTIGGEAAGEANTAVNGAGVYVSGSATTGMFNMSGGSITANKASNNGGAAYVSGGNITMTGGTINKNTAINGAGAYVTGGEFDMISGSLLNNVASSHGGGAYVHDGNITIGVENCNAEGTNHSVTYTDLAHPLLQNNDASYGGGLAADGGVINIYCGKIITNTADNAGMGDNIFMYDPDTTDDEKPVLNHINGTVGQNENHGMVVIGGEMNIPYEEGKLKITINYHDNGKELKFEVWVGEAPEEYYLNLPYCPQDWENKQNGNGLTFVGWTYDTITTKPPVQDVVDLSFIRDKEDYKALGDPVRIHRVDWKEAENGGYYIDFYAVWAPVTNNVSYDIDLLNGDVEDELGKEMTAEQKAGNTTSYTFSQTVPATITMTNPEIAGYEFKGWRITPSKDKISNWSTESNAADETVFYELGTSSGKANLAGYTYAYSDNKFTLTTDRNFGDIKMTAVFKEQKAKITYKVVGPADETADFGDVSIYFINENERDFKDEVFEEVYMANGDAKGAVAKENLGYKFVGWYSDEACTQLVGNEETFIPTKTTVNGTELYEEATYYAKFDYNLTCMTIKVADANIDQYQTLLFNVTGTISGEPYSTTVAIHHTGNGMSSVTIEGLQVGESYTVTPINDWSWRHELSAKESDKLEPNPSHDHEETNIVVFNVDNRSNKWLSAESYAVNKTGANPILAPNA
ncbi:MAG: hypothetical protein IJE09_02245 [Oscillospiraceae bacterium]|nr:hypothetical protein [Oscillospiraceae bacterium]